MKLAFPLLAAAALSAQPKPAVPNEKAPENFKTRFNTTKGDFVIAVNRSWAPLAADRFYALVKLGFYDGSAFFRVIPQFAAQFGIHPNPAVQAKWEKAPLKDEVGKQSNTLGHVSFAASGADSRTTQIFINLKDNKSLDRQGFTVFGDVVQGVGVSGVLYNGYSDRPDQGKILKLGAAYLKANFPKLDYIKKATIE
jgi:peptidyl-prolyl cis-trans isomerase A (cyclophilin A)